MSKKSKKTKNNPFIGNTNTEKEELLLQMPIIKTIEVETTEEGAKLYEEAKNTSEELLNNFKAELEIYKAEKIKEVDDSCQKKESELDEKIEDAIDNEIKTNPKIVQALEDAEKLKTEYDKKVKYLKAKAKKIHEDELTLSSELGKLEADKFGYEHEISEKVREQIKQELDDLKKDNASKKDLEKEKAKLQNQIEDLKKDINYYKNQFNKNVIRKSDVDVLNIKIGGLNNTIKQLTKSYDDLLIEKNNLEKQIHLYGDKPNDAIIKIEELEQKIYDLNDLYADCPSEEELERLRKQDHLNSDLQNKLNELRQKCNSLEKDNNVLYLNKEEIDNCRRTIKTLEVQKEELKRELARNLDLYENSCEKVFAALSAIDQNPIDKYPNLKRDSDFNLKKICDNFRGYLATRDNDPLYYEAKDIRTFISGLGSSRMIILEGLSGTGKSSLPRGFRDFFGATNEIIPVQSSWKDRNDLLGFYNDFKKQYKETKFLKALYSAVHNPDKIYILTLDEMNLSRCEYYFNDFITELEKPESEGWFIDLIPDHNSISSNENSWPKLIKDGKLQLTNNIRFVGTANKDDSTQIITDKVYDRSIVINFDKKGSKPTDVAFSKPIQINVEDLLYLLNTAIKNYKDVDRQRANEIVKKLDDFLINNFEITFGNRIMLQIEKFVPIYCACGGTVDEAIDSIFSRKVLRKLEGIYDEDTKAKLNKFTEVISESDYKLDKTIEILFSMIDKM